MKFSILTLGCKVNAYESSAMKEILLENGYFEAKENEISDVCIINTCSVTHVSDAKSRQMIRKMIKLIRNLGARRNSSPTVQSVKPLFEVRLGEIPKPTVIVWMV